MKKVSLKQKLQPATETTYMMSQEQYGLYNITE